MLNIGLLLLIINIIISYKGFKDKAFFNKYKFKIDSILIQKNYYRLITSGFLHVNWMHLIFNMVSLYFFSSELEEKIGSIYFLLIYFFSLISGNLLSTYIHRNHGDYTAVGASGAVCGIIFSSIAIFPNMYIGLISPEFFIPGWLYGILYVAYSILGIKLNNDNIGHDAHLGGAFAGIITAIILEPSILKYNLLIISLITLPITVFLYIIITKPHVLLLNGFKSKKYYNIDHKYNENKINKKIEIDKLLDKINNKGFENLSKKEKKKLEEYSK